MTLIVGDTTLKRKRCLAQLVVEHLIKLGHTAAVVEKRTNSVGHTDIVAVESSVGLVHISATGDPEPNAKLSASEFKDGSQKYLADKDYVAFGWNTKDSRTMIMFVPAKDVEDKKFLTKNEIKGLCVQELSDVLRSV